MAMMPGSPVLAFALACRVFQLHTPLSRFHLHFRHNPHRKDCHPPKGREMNEA